MSLKEATLYSPDLQCVDLTSLALRHKVLSQARLFVFKMLKISEQFYYHEQELTVDGLFERRNQSSLAEDEEHEPEKTVTILKLTKARGLIKASGKMLEDIVIWKSSERKKQDSKFEDICLLWRHSERQE